MGSSFRVDQGPRSVPMLGQVKSKMKSAIRHAVGTSQMDGILISRPSSGTDGLAPSPSLGGRHCLPGFPRSSKKFPVRMNRFPVPDHRETVAKAAVGLGNFDPSSVRRPESREIPCTFPAYQGSAARDQLPLDSVHLLGVRLGFVGSNRLVIALPRPCIGVALETGCPLTRSTPRDQLPSDSPHRH